MDICDIVFCSNSDEARAVIWAAILGLFGGFLALGGAVVVGLRQTAILAHQTDLQAKIASASLEVEQLKLRTDLFDRRFAVYEATRNWLLFTEGNERPPGLKRGEEGKLYRDFQAARDVARFVFPRNVFDTLEAIRLVGNDLAFVIDRMDKEDEVGPAVEEHLRLIEEVRRHINQMRDLFGAEMNLSSLRETQTGDIGQSGPAPTS